MLLLFVIVSSFIILSCNNTNTVTEEATAGPTVSAGGGQASARTPRGGAGVQFLRFAEGGGDRAGECESATGLLPEVCVG